ncbi:hypothetical protein [Cyanobium sp. Morenito 9A2]|uniref:hypothetical protein n=1 Tax=Cyanobium sp. Morenito 9A2 TaxID=2823718 RepID=UPI0020CD43D9|nr:hypothetical protein [Cyanobium sp. Morenito 9A2]MCP9849371.1 hypothetical protein [Cyanobium sp. Morenito 9A2]
MGTLYPLELLERLGGEARQLEASSRDLERNAWMVAHRHVHGVLPSEYDIREVPEDLFLAVLEWSRCRE